MGLPSFDGGYWSDSAFLHAVDAQDCWFVANVHCDQHIDLDNPDPVSPKSSGRGRRLKRHQAQRESLRVDRWGAEKSE